MGFIQPAKLSLIIAVAEIGQELGLVDENLFSSFMIAAIVTDIIGPFTGKYIFRKGQPERVGKK